MAQWVLGLGCDSRLIFKSDLKCLGFWKEASIMRHHTSFLDVSFAVVVVLKTQSGEIKSWRERISTNAPWKSRIKGSGYALPLLLQRSKIR